MPFLYSFPRSFLQDLAPHVKALLRRLKTIVFLSLLLTIAWNETVSPVLASPLPAALPGLSRLFAGSPPSNLGVENDRLAACPASPNCIVSQGGDSVHAIAPLTYQSDRQTAYETLLKILSVVPRTRIVIQTENMTQTEKYIRVEFASRLLGFVDDAEFYFPPEDGIIQVRSASRLGESDLGVNRTRMEQIRSLLSSP